MAIHGKSSLKPLTEIGILQIKEFAYKIKKVKWINGITYTNTPQARESAIELAKITGLRILNPLSLEPYKMGVASGITNEHLEVIDSESAKSLELFRLRIVDATQIKITGGEDIDSFDKRLKLWWKLEGKKFCNKKVIIGSNSTVLMITHILMNQYPKSGKYYCYTIPNGAFRVLERKGNCTVSIPDIKNSIYPDVKSSFLKTSRGKIVFTKFFPSWSPLNRKCVIAPGYFGNSRHGPYGLYVRLARKLAEDGIETYTFDYLGSGESTPITRTFATDCYSLNCILNTIEDTNFEIFVIGHSSGCAVVSNSIKCNLKICGIGLAPLCVLSDYSDAFFNHREFQLLLSQGEVIRKGIKLRLKYLQDIEENWIKYGNLLSKIIIAGNDQYDRKRNTTRLIGTGVITMPDADHNFSLKRSSFDLIQKINNIVKTGSQHCAEQQLS